MKMGGSEERKDAVMCRMSGKRRKRNVSERRTAGTSACRTTSACTQALLRDSRGKFLSKLLAATREKGSCLVPEDPGLWQIHERKQ